MIISFEWSSLLEHSPALGFVRSTLSTVRHSDISDILILALRTAVFGALTLAVRHIGGWVRHRIRQAYISTHDPCYLWIQAWIAQDPAAQAQILNFELTTSRQGQARHGSKNGIRAVHGHWADPHHSETRNVTASWASGEVIGRVLPLYWQTIWLKHGKNRLWVTRQSLGPGAGGYTGSTIQTVLWQRNALKEFIAAAHARYHQKEERELLIFHSVDSMYHGGPSFLEPVCRPARPWSPVILPDAVKENLMSDIEAFLSNEEVDSYASRGIPHRRGYLFTGIPGSGKTTLTTAIASKLQLDVYVINPAQETMDDARLNKMFREIPARSLILIEDIDCVLPSEASREAGIASSVVLPGWIPQGQNEGIATASKQARQSSVTLSGLLNAIDGVSSQEGCILIASTNHPEKLDPALRRPGRFDIQIPFHHATPAQAKALFRHFYPISHVDNSTIIDSRCSMSSEQLEELANRFDGGILAVDASAEGGEARKLSMAALQGFLIGYKNDPLLAVERAKDWARI